MKKIIENKIEEMLSKEYCCSIEELRGNEVIFSTKVMDVPYIKILVYREAVVVCTSEKLKPKVEELLKGKSRDEIFEIPLVYGQTPTKIVCVARDKGKIAGIAGASEIFVSNVLEVGVDVLEN